MTRNSAQARQYNLQTLDLLTNGRHEVTVQTLLDLLKECTRQKDISYGRKLSSYIYKKNNAEVLLYDSLIRMFAACGQLSDAWDVFRQVSKPSIYTWNAIISAHASLKITTKALQLYEEMKQKGFQPDEVTFLSALKACCEMKSACKGMRVHNDAVVGGYHLRSTVGNAVLDMYSKCGNLQEARKVFDSLEIRTVVSWGALMAGYVQHGHGVQALKLLERMHAENVKPNLIIYSSALKACSQADHLVKGRLVHDSTIRSGLLSDVIIQNTLVDMYAKSGSNEEAYKVFVGMANKDVASWGSLIAGYAIHGPADIAFELFHKMQRDGFEPCKATFLTMLKACVTGETINKGRMLHAQIIIRRYEIDTAVGNSIIDMYSKCGSLQEARRVFDRLQDCNVVSWGALISGYAAHGLGTVAIQLFQEMCNKGITFSISILTSLLKACEDENDSRNGRLVHFLIMDLGVETESFENMIPVMYARCGNFEDALSMLKLFQKNVNMRASVLAHCFECHNFEDVLSIFELMQRQEVEMNNVIYSSILTVCINSQDLQKGRLAHEDIICDGFDHDVIVGNKLVDLYAKFGLIDEAHKIFSLLLYRDSVSWSAIITGYVEHSLNFAALELYEKLQCESLVPNEATLLSVLKACGSLGALYHGQLIHDQIIRDATQHGIALGSTILDMYAKCGSVREAHKSFNNLPQQDVIAWGALISGYTRNGSSVSALKILKLMGVQNTRPDEVILTNALAACSHGGLLKEGRFHMNSLTEQHNIIPGKEQVSCMADLLGRSGELREAQDMHSVAPTCSDQVSWISLLTSCRTYQSSLEKSSCSLQAT